MTRWADHLYSLQELRVDDSSDLGQVFHQLVMEQRTRWSDLRNGVAAWAKAKRRHLMLDTKDRCHVELLCNPARFANVTIVPGQARVCPLCLENLPSAEMGVSIGPSLIVLPNPTPIIKDHVVISHREHNEQALSPHLEEILSLLAASKGDVAILYNGASSGASTPHHLHFQGGSSSDLPLLHQISGLRSRRVARHMSCTIRAVECEGRRFLLLLSRDVHLLTRVLRRIVNSEEDNEEEDNKVELHFLVVLFRIVNSEEDNEEMELNLVMWKQASDLAVGLFPRGAHRPRCYYHTGQDQILVSPGSMEMAGLMVVPRHEDWNRLTADDVRKIYGEVCLDDTAWHRFVARLETQNDG